MRKAANAQVARSRSRLRIIKSAYEEINLEFGRLIACETRNIQPRRLDKVRELAKSEEEQVTAARSNEKGKGTLFTRKGKDIVSPLNFYSIHLCSITDPSELEEEYSVEYEQFKIICHQAGIPIPKLKTKTKGEIDGEKRGKRKGKMCGRCFLKSKSDKKRKFDSVICRRCHDDFTDEDQEDDEEDEEEEEED
ncbi:hypothetical protein TREMEDRAFT_66308 [Tremella mesenterica DSM 1558]|uniref:uncharacterized protein n=1 Tax=Tremella mesenterica (strain ATCC 24925 / CBS 8224 / DSM 1558 / NBRC 9311 / NRRL Y-6157 / RJB 2259-6 / UBC 559-6) TaxID=578456 RepID=UPI00032C6A16|nr:uncharacterized protein TREMEDRAFT_66308 [Tremella mesenterica DSM 1558]EIW65711.1 hypothetical protein TREMEDRAFT_66308 [Tremella mesenterica DSM 1558]